MPNYISPYSRPDFAEIYEALITSDQNPVELWFPYREEAERYQLGFYLGLEEHNRYVYSAVHFKPNLPSSYKVALIFWI